MGTPKRLQAVVEIIRTSWVFRVLFPAWVVVSIYDQWSGNVSQVFPQLQLPALGALVMGGSHLLPLWGWLLVLQAILTAVVMEYVVRKMQILMEHARKLGELESALATKIGPDRFGPVEEVVSKTRNEMIRVKAEKVDASIAMSWVRDLDLQLTEKIEALKRDR